MSDFSIVGERDHSVKQNNGKYGYIAAKRLKMRAISASVKLQTSF
jgi:hypothetical protein